MNYLVSCCHQLVHNKLFKNKMRTKVHLGISLGPSKNQLSGRDYVLAAKRPPISDK
jgi:hypothetical protein